MANPTIVSGVIVDPGSIPYYPAKVTATLTPSAVFPSANGQPINPNPGVNMTVVALTNTDGSFTMSLFGNALITPAATQWLFTVTTTGEGRPSGFASLSFAVAITVSGTTQDVGATLSAAAPALLQVDSGGGGGVPGDPVNSVQFNNAGAFGGDADFLYDNTLHQHTMTGDIGANFGNAFTLNASADSTHQITGLFSTVRGASGNVAIEGDAILPVGSDNGSANGLNVFAGTSDATAVHASLIGVNSTITSGGSQVDRVIHFAAYSLGQLANVTNSFSFYSYDMTGATNSYYSWFDSSGVRRVKEDTLDGLGLGQAIEALYNPRFTKYTPGATNYERIVLGQWVNNVAQIGTEAGGTGTPRGLELIGPSVKIDGTIGFYGGTPAAKPTVTGAKLPSDVALASLLAALVALGLITDSTT